MGLLGDWARSVKRRVGLLAEGNFDELAAAALENFGIDPVTHKFDPNRIGFGMGGIGLTFAGKSAAAADLQQAARAQTLADLGKTAEEIWKETGWWVPTKTGPNPPGGAPRFEIHDPANLTLQKVTETGMNKATSYENDIKMMEAAKRIKEFALSNNLSIGDAVHNMRLRGDVIPEGAIYTAKHYDDVFLEHIINELNKNLNNVMSFPAPLGERMQHKALYYSYPKLADIPVGIEKRPGGLSGYSGVFIPKESGHPGEISLAQNLQAIPDRTSVGLHEVQHAVQHQEPGFSYGGGPQTAPQRLAKMRKDVLSPLEKQQREAELFGKTIKPYWYAQNLLRLQKHIDNPRTPYQLMRSANWYENSDKIRRVLGPAPRKPGPYRDKWIREAAQMLYKIERINIHNREGFAMNNEIDNILKNKSLKQIDSKARSLETKLGKIWPADDRMKFFKEQERFEKLENLTPYEIYYRLGGEAEARATQKRWGMTPEERRATPPWLSYDVPLDEIIP